MLSALFFYLFAITCVGAAFMVIAVRNPVHAVLFLILAFFNAAGLFVLLGAEFLAMILIVVYVGAVLVLFLFVVMMLDVDFAVLKAGFLKYLPVGATVGLLLLVELILIVGAWITAPEITAQAPTPPAVGDQQHRGHRAHSLHPLCLSVRGGRPDPARRHDRRHRAHAAAQARRAPAEGLGASRPDPRSGCRAGRGRIGEGALMTIGLSHYLTVAAVLFTLGIFGIFLNRKNVIVILMSIELMLLAVNLNLVAFSAFHGDLVGQIFAMIVLTVAAAEAAIGLAIVVVYFRNRGTIDVAEIDLLKG